jgi:p-aminobenzoyl-glutamate transporter AbgT
LPDPVFIFVWLIGILMLISAVAAWLGMSAVNPITGETLTAQSLLSRDNLQQFLTSMPETMTGFTPLGLTLVIMLGAGVAGTLRPVLRRPARRSAQRAEKSHDAHRHAAGAGGDPLV